MYMMTCDAEEADQGAGDVVTVGPVAVGDHAPGQGTGNEYATVGGEDATEVGVGLQGGDEAVEAEADDASSDPDPAVVLADALPHEPGTADLDQGGNDEHAYRLCDQHDGACAPIRSATSGSAPSGSHGQSTCRHARSPRLWVGGLRRF